MKAARRVRKKIPLSNNLEDLDIRLRDIECIKDARQSMMRSRLLDSKQPDFVSKSRVEGKEKGNEEIQKVISYFKFKNLEQLVETINKKKQFLQKLKPSNIIRPYGNDENFNYSSFKKRMISKFKPERAKTHDAPRRPEPLDKRIRFSSKDSELKLPQVNVLHPIKVPVRERAEAGMYFNLGLAQYKRPVRISLHSPPKKLKTNKFVNLSDYKVNKRMLVNSGQFDIPQRTYLRLKQVPEPKKVCIRGRTQKASRRKDFILRRSADSISKININQNMAHYHL